MLASLRDNPPSTAEHSANTLNLSNWQNCLLIFCAAFAGLAIPTSTAAQNIGSGLLALCAIFIGPLRRQIAQAARQPFGMACLALFGWLAIATLWSGVAWSDRLEMLEKMRMYLFAPVLLAAMAQRSARQGLLFGFSLGAAISAVISIGLALTQTSWLNTQAEINNWPVFRSHTYHDLFLAWLIIGLSLAILSRKLSRGAVIAASILIVVCAADAMLLVRGRSAQVLLLAMLVWLAFRWNWRRALLQGKRRRKRKPPAKGEPGAKMP